jgi:hypothetical protein
MKKILGLSFAAVALFMAACKKDNYIKGGSIHNPNVNMTTVDYLRKNPLFDTLCLLIDKAGIADKINAQGISFFAPTDYHIAGYLDYKARIAQRQDSDKKYTIDSLIKYDLNAFRDSIGVYIINKSITYGDLSQTARPFTTALNNTTANISYEEVRDEKLGYNPATGVFPRLVYFQYDGKKTYCQTSGIITTTGNLFVIQNPQGEQANSPTLYFRKQD